MNNVIGSLAVVLVLLIIAEALFNAKKLRGEFGRKFVHITVGTFVAFWPFYMSFHSIQLISIAFLLVVLASRQLKIFKAIHAVGRKSWGDFLFAIGIGLTAFITSNKWIFLTAILNLSLADGLAAVVGKRFGKGNRYKVFGYEKSAVGTLTFYLASLIILTITLAQSSNHGLSWLLLILLPVTAAGLENLAVVGFDNIFVPLLIVVALSPLKFAT